MSTHKKPVTNVSEYVAIMDARKNAPATINENGIFIHYKGGKLTPNEFDKALPIPVLKRANYKGINPCRAVDNIQ